MKARVSAADESRRSFIRLLGVYATKVTHQSNALASRARKLPPEKGLRLAKDASNLDTAARLMREAALRLAPPVSDALRSAIRAALGKRWPEENPVELDNDTTAICDAIAHLGGHKP